MSGKTIAIGHTTRPHGIRGEVIVVPTSGNPERLRHLAEVFLDRPKGRVTLAIEQVRTRHADAIVKFAGIDDRDAAEEAVGYPISIPFEDLPELEPGTFYVHDIIGLRVESESGEPLGEIVDVASGAGNDLYVLRAGGREHLIPAAGEIVREIDLAAGKMVIRVLDGLLDLERP
jgi:16S rRNA processing protein RimM